MLRWKNKKINDLDSKKFISNSGTYVILGAALLAMTFFGVCDPSGQLVGPRGTAASVGGEDISGQDFRRVYQYEYSMRQNQMGESFDPAALKLASSVLDRLVNERVLYLSAVKMGLKASQREVIQSILKDENFKGENGKFSEEVFKDILRNNGFSEASYEEVIRRSLTVQNLQQFLIQSTFVSNKAVELEYQLSETKNDIEYLKIEPKKLNVAVAEAQVQEFAASEAGKEKIKKYYDANLSEFKKEERVKARHILVGFEGARNASADAAQRSEEDAKKRAEEIFAKVKADGADFEAIAKEMTDEPSGKTSGGDLGFFGKTEMVPEFSEAAFAMNVGDISEPVKSPFGFHVIKVEGKEPASERTLEQATNEIAENLILEERRPLEAQERADKLITTLKEGGDVAALLQDSQLSWQSTGEVAANSRFVPGLGADEQIQKAIASLNTKGQLYPEVVDVRGTKYILRLKDRKEADTAKLDAERRRQLASSAELTEGYSLLSTIQNKAEEDWKERVWKNPDYLELDTPRNQNAGS